jgi:two-component system response regulator YesN
MLNNLDLSLDMGNFFNVLIFQLRNTLPKDKLVYYMEELHNYWNHKGYKHFILENQFGYNELNILLFSSKEYDLSKLKMFCFSNELIEEFNDFISLIGISNTMSGFTQLNKAYFQSMDALKNKSLLDRNSRYIHFEDISSSKKFTNFFTAEDERTLTYYIESGNHSEIETRITQIFNSMNNDSQITTKALMKLYYEMILLLENLLNKYSLSVEQVLDFDFITLTNAPKSSSVEQLKELLTSFSIKASEQLSSSSKDDPKTLLNKIKTYIENNYYKDVTLDFIAHKFYISKTYFSQLFKKEVGITFINYLTRVRMNHAEQLLKNNNLKVYEIARMVGYSDPLYFGQVFKKYFGVLPSEYTSSIEYQEKE